MPKKNPYDIMCIELAIREIQSNNMSLRAAAKKYGVPKSTLNFKIKNPGHKDTCGPSPILTAREESELVKWIEELAQRGFPRKKEDILNSVQNFLTENPRPNPFKNNRPGECWFKAFLRRHPTIVQRTSEAVSAASACVSESDIKKWFIEIEDYLKLKNIDYNDPSRIFNGDETGFQICPSTGKVFASKGSKNVYTVDKGSQKESITVMFTFSASGMTCPPMIVYPYKRIPEKISVTVNAAWGIGRSDNVWMTADTFYDYIKNIFQPFLIEKNIQFPVVLFLDGHKSHLTYDLSLLCSELNIEVIALYPNATRILQPCDVAVFRPIKIGWKKGLREFYANNPGEVLNKISFAPLLEKVVTEVVKPQTLINGFRACGLFPFNADAIDYSKCLGKDNKREKVEALPETTMDYNTYLQFVGNERVEKFKSLGALLNDDELNAEFVALYNMWKFFHTTEFENNHTVNETDQAAYIKDPKIVQQTNIQEDENLVVGDTIDLEFRNGDLEDNVHSEAKVENSTKVIVLSDVHINEGNLTDASKNLSLVTEPIKRKNINDYLNLPDQPQRKNKRNIERVSYAITSRLYQQTFEAKRALKLEEERKKLDRKRKREEAATAKLNRENKKKMCKDKGKDTICFVCQKVVKKAYLTCDGCKQIIHRGCVPKAHKRHIPDLDDVEDDLFMCHVCYKEESEEEYNEESETSDQTDKEGEKEEMAIENKGDLTDSENETEGKVELEKNMANNKCRQTRYKEESETNDQTDKEGEREEIAIENKGDLTDSENETEDKLEELEENMANNNCRQTIDNQYLQKTYANEEEEINDLYNLYMTESAKF